LAHVNHMIGATSTTKKKLALSYYILTCVNKLCTKKLALSYYILTFNMCFELEQGPDICML
jgi:hypothetical protein